MNPARLVAPAIALLSCVGMGTADGQSSDEKLAQRVAKIDERYVKVLEELAAKYDKEKDPEAASFFAEVAVGFGSKDEKVKAIKLSCEIEVYLGKLQGGKPLGNNGPIRVKLDPFKNEYKKIVEELFDKSRGLRVKNEELSETERKTLFDVMVKYELARGGDEYIKATKRVNELRRGMKLRSILWDFENSRKLIVGAAPAAAAGDYAVDPPEKVRRSVFYDAKAYDFMMKESGFGFGSLVDWVETCRSMCFWREDLLNPNARRLWLGQWDTLTFTHVTGYRIPLLPFREDIPTPTKRFEGETVAKDWVDTEELFEVGGRKIPFVRYPFEDEKDLPWCFGGPGYGYVTESRLTSPLWSRDESDSLMKTKAGLPVMLRFFGKAKLADVEASLSLANGGKAITSRVYTNCDARVPGIGDWPTIVLVPEGLLGRGVKYTVTIKCKVEGTPFERTWTFSTREK